LENWLWRDQFVLLSGIESDHGLRLHVRHSHAPGADLALGPMDLGWFRCYDWQEWFQVLTLRNI
jgi:hypothetical protein